jgi:recombination protein RecR
LGPRSARRAALELLKKREPLLRPLASALAEADAKLATCPECHNIDVQSPCSICRDTKRENDLFCVVEDVGDLWALERTHAFKGRYHVLGGVLSALAGITPEQLHINQLVARAKAANAREVVLALSATVDGQATAHFIADRLREEGIAATRLGHGMPMGGELDYLDEGTLMAALAARRVA